MVKSFKYLLLVILTTFNFIFPSKILAISNSKTQKTVLILHGWPQPIEERSSNKIFLEYFKQYNYNIVAPKLFTNEFNLTVDDSKIYIKDKLNGVKPDVIVGIAFGGLVVPIIAQEYPQAKLVFIASTPKMKPESKSLKIIVDLAKNKNYFQILDKIKFFPQKIFFNVYNFIMLLSGSSDDRDRYLSDMKINIDYILDIPLSEESEVVKFVTTTDNTEILKSLKNKTIIFSGKNDLLMPNDNENGFKKLLKNSILIETEGGHFGVFTKDNFQDLHAFLD